eukprot:8837405-Lingulodinium_polyedra.AAC.1
MCHPPRGRKPRAAALLPPGGSVVSPRAGRPAVQSAAFPRGGVWPAPPMPLGPPLFPTPPRPASNGARRPLAARPLSSPPRAAAH